MANYDKLPDRLNGLGIPALTTLDQGIRAINAADAHAQVVIDEIQEVGGSAASSDVKMAHRLIGLGIGTVAANGTSTDPFTKH